MLKWVLLALLAWGVYVLLFKRRPSHQRHWPAESPPAASEDMVRCARCGVHLPRSEAILSGGELFCCEAHRAGHPD